MTTIQKAARPFNALVSRLVTSPRWSRLVAGHTTLVTYTGRRSGRTISTPVSYSRRGSDIVTIHVELPDSKTWWRNFDGEGGRLSLRLDGVERTGHAVAARTSKRRVLVTVHLDLASVST